MNENSILRTSLAEAFGTFALVLVGTGSIVVNDVSGGALGHVGVSLAFGLVVMAMIYTIGDVSGAHINPAVTIGFWLARRFEGRRVLPYVAAQCAGAFAASAFLRLLFPDHATLGATIPADTVWQSFALELVMTWLLMWVILCVSVGSRETGIMAGVAVGAVIAFEALFGGPISGASMNPARSLAPALLGDGLGVLWLYVAAPIAGAAIAVPMCRLLRIDGCCDGPGAPGC